MIDPDLEEALHETPTLLRFASLGGLDAIPDETTIFNFCRLLETQGLVQTIFERVNARLARKGRRKIGMTERVAASGTLALQHQGTLFR